MRTLARRVLATLGVALLVSLLTPGVGAQSPVGSVVISQVYGAGGAAGAPLRNDYVELFNRGAAPVSLGGLSVQYASATGTGFFAVGAALPAVTLAPSQYFLVQLGGGANGVPLPAPDATGRTLMAAGAGKVVLVNQPTQLTCNGGTAPCSPAQQALIVDLVGYGNANYFEGPAAAPTISSTTAAFRRLNGCKDTSDNAADFTVAAPAPRNTASPPGSCAAPPEPEPPLVLPHEVQGPGASSPLVAATVRAEGVVTARKFNGFFVQTAVGAEDGDPASSEGLFVFTSSAPAAAAQPGRLVRVTGTVAEYVPGADPGSAPLTELTFVTAITDQGAAALPAPVLLTPAEVSAAGGLDQLERFEGMRVSAASLTAVSGTAGNTDENDALGLSDGTFYAVLTGEARPFREPGIEAGYLVLPCEAAPAPCNIPVFDGNPERLRVDSDALEGTVAANVNTGAVMAGVTGPLDFAFRTYTLLPETTLAPAGGMTATAVTAAGANEYTVASFNMERFFDTVNDAGVGDVALTPLAYANRKAKASLAIRTALNLPDILGVQEMENLATLQDLATTINADALAATGSSPEYTAYLAEGNDPGGIDVGFLVKTGGGRVTVTSVEQVGLDDTFIDPSDGSVDLLNDRPPLVLRATVQGPATSYPAPVTVINNHLRSLNGAEENSPTGVRVRAKRRAQAEFLAAYIQGRQLNDPNEAIVSIGDYNAFAFNDGYGDSLGAIRGVPAPADQVVTASPDLVSPDLVDVADLIAPADRYSYVFGGNAQTLDHVLVTSNLLPQVSGLQHARVNADFAQVLRSDLSRPERLSDHDPAVAYFAFVPDTVAPSLVVPGAITAEATGPSGALVSFAVSATDDLDPDVAVSCSVPTPSLFPIGSTLVSCTAEDAAGNTSTGAFSVVVEDTTAPVMGPVSVSASTLWPANHKMVAISVSAFATDAVGAACAVSAVASSEPDNGLGDGDTTGDSAITGALAVSLRAERSGTGDGRIYTITVTCRDAAGNATTDTAEVAVPKSQKK